MDFQEQAKKVLEQNNRGGYTVPSPRLYPFQWNWDSGFIALGLSYINEEDAFSEIRKMFKGQWSNGMLPHINFHHEDPSYFPGPELWGSKECKWAPQNLSTSGITQPPVYGFIISMMAEKLWDKSSSFREFVREVYPKIVASHKYLYEFRDPYHEGLVYIHHNWESADNSPVWDETLENIDVSNARDVSAERRDLKHADAAQRPTNENYKRYIYLVDLCRKCDYDDAKILAECPFLIQDMLFNAMLVRSNEGLIHIASLISEDAAEIEAWNKKSIASLNTKCWSDTDGFYYDFDLKQNKIIPIKVSGGLMPLFAGVCTDEQAGKLIATLMESFGSNGFTLCSSTAVDEPQFNPVKYWRGPIWINLNWMLYHGLKRYGFEKEAGRVKKETIELVEKNGFYEYFDPRPDIAEDNRKLGGDFFSWTAALYLDFVYNNGNSI